MMKCEHSEIDYSEAEGGEFTQRCLFCGAQRYGDWPEDETKIDYAHSIYPDQITWKEWGEPVRMIATLEAEVRRLQGELQNIRRIARQEAKEVYYGVHNESYPQDPH